MRVCNARSFICSDVGQMRSRASEARLSMVKEVSVAVESPVWVLLDPS